MALLAVLVILALALLLRVARRPASPPAASAPVAASAPAAAPAAPHHLTEPEDSAPAVRLVPARLAAEPSAAAGAFTGQVVSAETGAGVAGAELTFASDAGAASVHTDAGGRFRFAPPSPGPYQLATVSAEGFLPFAPEWGQSPVRLTAVAGQRVEGILLALTPELELLGRVLSPEGTPVAGAQVRLTTGHAGESVLHPVADRFVSDAKGEFRFRAPEQAALEARHPDYEAGRAVVGAVARAARVVELRLRPRAPGADGGTEAREVALAGQVVDARGQPVGGALVTAHSSARRFPTRYGDELGYQASTDEQGRFALEGVREGSYDLDAQAEGLAPGRLDDVAAGRADLRLVLAEGALLTGRVRDAASGAPLPSFSVAVSQAVGPLRREGVAEQTVLDPEGRYRVAGVPSGELVVEVAAPGHAPAEARVQVPEGAKGPLTADFALEPGARLTGTVVERDSGKPLADARVSLESGQGGGALSVRLDARTDASGAFALEGLAPGRATLVASLAGHHTRLLSGVPVERGQASAPVRIELTATKPGEEPSVELMGIGVVLAARDDMLVVGEVMAGGGGAEAGLSPGDGILSIDGQPVAQVGFSGAVGLIRGPEDSRVLLGVQRGAALAPDGGAGAPVQPVWVVRRRIRR
ncbi:MULTISPECIES: carboxypeptidase regulatory-like domain-containing protein [Myxococcaceae]|uniref:carboxypeptidase regulatory-like domain-containing protein n=1 Tax=Myxococcaceae TaxID=31 RepID=UPI00188EADB8|nr:MULTISPECIES: carboxypeptidase regulatory-like domain-containing protein [Myxococcaceae]MBF5042532.1 carboxypeptidase regulatory-like domain-containing protein [Simulacricoccus sp. 17bor-14]